MISPSCRAQKKLGTSRGSEKENHVGRPDSFFNHTLGMLLQSPCTDDDWGITVLPFSEDDGICRDYMIFSTKNTRRQMNFGIEFFWLLVSYDLPSQVDLTQFMDPYIPHVLQGLLSLLPPFLILGLYIYVYIYI